MNAAGLVLAAGASRRLGRCKQLLPLGGRPLLAWPVRALRAAGVAPLVVVLGHDADLIGAAMDLTGVQVVVNPHFAVGMSTSLRAGLDVLPADVEAVLIVTGDQPFVTSDHLRAMIATAQGESRAIVATEFGDFAGVPVLLKRTMWPQARHITGDQGARVLVRRFPSEVVTLAAPNPQMALDVDTEEQYRMAQDYLSGEGSGLS